MSAARPLVEKLGLVLPRRNGPHSGRSKACHPSSLLASSRMSLQPMSASGQPSASAMGWGMAMTSGVTMKGCPSPTIGGSPASLSRSLRTGPHVLAAGDHTTGRGPSACSSQPPASACMAPPDALRCGRTKTQRPFDSARSLSLNSRASSVRSAIFSDDTAMSTVMQSPGSAPARPAVSSPLPSSLPSSDRLQLVAASRATATASTSHRVRGKGIRSPRSTGRSVR